MQFIAQQTTRKRPQQRVSKKLDVVNRLFRELPRQHKTATVYRALGSAAGIKAESLDRHASVALSLIEGATHGA